MFANLSGCSGRQDVSSGRARPRKRRPSLETLEGRQLMSLGSEFLAPINTTTRNAQFDSDNASSSNGTSVVVWTDTFSLSDHDIRAQRFDRFGAKLGPEIVVSFSSLDEGSPAVAMDAQGNFEVTWVQTQVGGDTNVLARRFNSNGAAVGAIVQVGVGTFKETDPDVAIDDRGDFVVSYTRNTNNNNPDIFAKLYNSSDQLLNVVSVATTARAETHSSVAMTPDGRFDVAWEEAFSTPDHDIKLNRYSASGGLLGSDAIALSTAFEDSPSVSVDNFDNAVVAYDRSGTSILARRVGSNGSLGAEINIASSSTGVSVPSVALKRGGGGFVVAYQTYENGLRTKVGEVTAFNAVLTYDAGLRTTPAVSINGFDDYILTYTSSDAGDANIRGRRGHLFF
jgi:hypothetical protein